MNLFQPTHLIILMLIVVLLFGGNKIPELMRGVGKGVGELQKGIEEGKRSLQEAAQATAHDHEDDKPKSA